MLNKKNEVVLITGASSGLGRSLALKAAESGSTIIMIARNKENLNLVKNEVVAKGGQAYAFAFDLHEIERIPGLYKDITSKIGKTPTILINNVGYNAVGFVQNTPIEIYERCFRANTFAPIVLVQCVLPDMLKKRKGVIVNIMSGVMYHSFPGVSPYCASKVALGAIHESLKAELWGLPIKTLYVNPGGFRSNFFKKTEAGGRLKDYKFPEFGGPKDPGIVASAIYKAIEQGEEEVNLGSLMDKVGYHLNYWIPKLVDKIIVIRNKKILEKRPL